MAFSLTHQQFIDNCRDIVSRQLHVQINEAAVEAFAATIKASSFVPDWKDYVSSAANADPYDFKRAFYEMAMITAHQGGFIDADAQGVPRKWQKDGSGAKAMVEKMAAIRAAKLLPFYDLPEQDIDRLKSLLADMPFADKRLAIFKEFADAQKHQQVMDLLDAAYDGEKYKIDMTVVNALAKIMPTGLGDDPFLKKALLTPLLAAGHAHHYGVTVDTSDLVPATDYILPQVLNADHIGILSFSEVLTDKLEKRAAFAEDAEEVTALRAATVLVCDKLIEKSGLSPQEIDGFLWLAGRKLQNARPHMMCYTMRF